jgi:tetratricopeptide (TPR) repeat protein
MLNLRALIIRSGGNSDQHKEEVLQIYNRVFRESQDYLGIGEVDTWIATNNICGILLQLDRISNMEPVLWETITRAIATKIKTEGKFDTSVVEVYHKAGVYSQYLDSRHGVNSKNSLEFKELLEAWRFTGRLENATSSPSSQIDALNTVGVYRQRKGQYGEAEQYHIRALELCEINGMHDHIPLLRYNQMLAIGRSGRMSEAEAYRQRFLGIIVQEEAIHGSLERRMIDFEDDKKIYHQAKEMVGKGAMMPNDPWFQDNIRSIQRAEDRYGALFNQTV